LAAIALEAVAKQIGRRPRARHFELKLKITIGKTFYANVGMARAAKEAEGRKDALAHLRWRRFTLQGKLKARRHESPEDWLKRLRREREVIWWALTKDASDEELLRAGSWLLQRVTEADIVILTDKGLLPTRRFEADVARLQRIIVRSNVRLLPLPPKPEHWTQPTIYRSGLKVNFLPHHNKAHQVSIIKSFKSRRFQNQHRAAANRLGDVPLRIDHWTLDLVDRYAVAVKDYKDEHRRLAYGQEIDRTVAEASRLLRRGAFCNTYHIDFRGRLYSDQDFNYARGDSIRSLYRFDAPALLGKDGFRWLLVNAANCFGLDKLSYEERVAWTKSNYSEIDRAVENPRSMFDWWSKADKPSPS
jgi:DNA-dependent RNA polymerase